ncbi:MAG: inosine/xanthosine triphosphatase [Candidatus Asgardarchaeia archaeon]
MKLVVGSTNPVKINAVKNAFMKLFDITELDVNGVDVSSGVSNQPTSLEEIILGANNRAKNAKQAAPGADFYFGIEAGIFRIPDGITKYIDFAVCIVLDKNDRKSIGFSPGFEYPPFVIRKIFEENKEVGDIFDEFLGEKDVKKKMGAIGFLSRGIVPRETFIEFSVIMALIPFHPDNIKLYFPLL